LEGNGSRQFEPIPIHDEALATVIVDAAFCVHKALGAGLMESVYEVCLRYELERRGVPCKAQVDLPVVYRGVQLDAGLRLDLLVGDRVIVELKSVERIHPVHEAQLLTYLKLTGLRLGLLINFNTHLIKDGIKRMVR
jgi:GxxExxY protein